MITKNIKKKTKKIFKFFVVNNTMPNIDIKYIFDEKFDEKQESQTEASQ